MSSMLARGLATFSVVLAALAVPSAGSGQTTCAAPCPAPSLSATPAAAAPAADPRVGEVEKADAELDRAIVWGDLPAATAILDDAMISVDGFDAIRTREKILERIRPRKTPPTSTVTPSQVTVKLAGDTAVLTARKTSTFQFNGHSDSRQYRETNTYARRAGRWRLVSSVTTDEDPPYVAPDVSLDMDFDPSSALGAANAQIVLYEFSDYECPFCRRFAAQTLSRVEKDYVQTGRVAIVFRDNPLDFHPRAAAAAAAGACAESLGKRWPMSEKLLKDPVALSDEDFRRYAREVGLDPAAFDRCLSDPSTAAKIRRGMDDAYRIGVKGAPIFFAGVRVTGEKKVHLIRKIEGAQPYEVFQATLDGILRAAGR